MKAVILAAGEGVRCRPLTLTRSKVMLPVANKPTVEYVVRALHDSGIRDVVMVVGYAKERIMNYFGNGKDFDVHIEYAEQKQQLGTAHTIKQAKGSVDDEFLVLLNRLFSSTSQSTDIFTIKVDYENCSIFPSYFILSQTFCLVPKLRSTIVQLRSLVRYRI